MSQRRPFIQKNLWKWLDCAHKLGGQGLRESGQTSSISQAEGDADMVTACICILMGGWGSTRNQWFLLAPPSDKKLSL